MSLAGTRSSQGDEFQLRIALHWLIRLLKDASIHGIQAESVGLPGDSVSVSVDDVVVIYEDGRFCFIQAKKNQPKHRYWSFKDKVLQDELRKARDQLETKEHSEVWFYSRSPFGDLKTLAEGCRSHPGFQAFSQNAPNTLASALSQLATIIGRSDQEAFSLAQRIKFGPTYEYEDWDRQNRADLDHIIPRPDLAMPILERLLGSHQAKLRDAVFIITRNDVLDVLAKHGLSPTPKRSEAEILEAFSVASRIGRHWLRTVAGERIPRAELGRLIELIDQGSQTILLMDRAGSGKTCLLLDLADHIEAASYWGLLFIKGDHFSDVNTEQGLVERGLPGDIVGQCARLAAFRQVVVVIDSLDVLSLNRSHGALKVFLGLIDRLEKIDNVTVIAACRDFDLQYDPLLRGRKWQHKVTLEALDFESVVKPFLHAWGIDPDTIGEELRKLLQLPQNLRLFEKLARLRTASHPVSAYELYERFLEEVVAKDSQLGNGALAALQDMAEGLMRQRMQSYPRVAFRADEAAMQRLISQEVLFETSSGVLTFSHQTLADCLMVRSALARNKTMAEFILDHPPLPFIRPAVRAFFFYLRAHQPDAFRREVWAVLSNDEIAYHLRRLVSESFAEIIPVEEDWPFLRRFFKQYPDLFRRLFWRANSDAWFQLLTQHWLPEAKKAKDREVWLFEFVRHLRGWMNRHPSEVVSLWQEALTFAWIDRKRLASEISMSMHTFDAWRTAGVRKLLETLVEEVGDDRYFLGKHLSRWAQANKGGDDLLWRYIIRDVTPSDTRLGNLAQKLRCRPDEFHDEEFLADRLCRYDQLLSLALAISLAALCSTG